MASEELTKTLEEAKILAEILEQLPPEPDLPQTAVLTRVGILLLPFIRDEFPMLVTELKERLDKERRLTKQQQIRERKRDELRGKAYLALHDFFAALVELKQEEKNNANG